MPLIELPGDEVLTELLGVAFHASLMREERRGVAFRLGFFSGDDLSRYPAVTAVEGERRYHVRLLNPRPFNVSELVRLAPATDPTKTILSVELRHPGSQELMITGLFDFSGSWWAAQRGEASYRFLPPDVFTVTAFEPGNLHVSREGADLLILRRGRMSKPIRRILYEGPVANFFNAAQSEFYRSVCLRLGTSSFGTDDHYPLLLFNNFTMNTLMRVVEQAHGGAIVVVRDELSHDDSRLTDRVHIKHRCDFARAWEILLQECVAFRTYYEHHFAIWDQEVIDKQKYQRDIRNDIWRTSLEIAHRDTLTLIASLAAVDGAVVLTDRLRLLGFGAEIIAQSPTLNEIP
jgi:hypothetical protein